MKKLIKLSAMAAACTLFTAISATTAYAGSSGIEIEEDLFYSSGNNIIYEDICSFEPILTYTSIEEDHESMCLDEISSIDSEDILYGSSYVEEELPVISSKGSGSSGKSEVTATVSRPVADNKASVNKSDEEISGTGRDGYDEISAPTSSVVAVVRPVTTVVKTVANGGSSNSNNGTAVNTGKDKGTVGQNNGTAKTAPQLSDAQKALQEINAIRARAGVKALTLNDKLTRAATARAGEVTECYSHNRPDGSRNVTILSQYGISYNMAGENITCMESTPHGAVASWAASSTHNRCMTNSDYIQAGIGTVTVDGCTYWVLILTD